MATPKELTIMRQRRRNSSSGGRAGRTCLLRAYARTSCSPLARDNTIASIIRPFLVATSMHEYCVTTYSHSSRFMRAIEMIQSLKPAPMRVAELATSFTTSQVNDEAHT
jgi:hypothetical protein